MPQPPATRQQSSSKTRSCCTYPHVLIQAARDDLFGERLNSWILPDVRQVPAELAELDNERLSTQIQHALQQMEALMIQVDLSWFHDVSPTENFPIGAIEVRSGDTACLDQRSQLEV